MLRSTTRQGTDYGAQRDLEGERVINDSESMGPEHSRCSPKGSPVSGKGLTKENIGRDIKREDVGLGVIDRTSERESDMDYAILKFLGGLKEPAHIAPTTREALLLDMGVPKDSVERVIQIYLSCYGHFLTKGDKKDESHRRRHRTRQDTEGELKHPPRRDSDEQEHKEHRRKKGERVNRSSKDYTFLKRIQGDIGNPGRSTEMSEERICRYGLITL